jgi:glycosyltransferase involved in cell wall biosynthesis
MLRIGFDAKRALRNRTGLGNYSRNLLRGLHASQPELDLHLYSSRPPAPLFGDFPAEISATVHVTPRGSSPEWWRTFRAGRAAARDGMHIFHGLSHEIPRDIIRTDARSVVSFADLIYETHPEFFPAIDRLSYRWRYRWSARHADAIVAISNHTRQQLLEHYGIDPARISVIPPARDPRFSHLVPDSDRAAVRGKYQLPSEFLLSVGTLESRKNQAVLVNAVTTLDREDVPPLVLVGRDGGRREFLEKIIEHYRLGHRVLIRTEVDAADLPALMQSALVFAYPSVIEGFGMPIVEALSCGIPVVASAGGWLDEAGGPDSRYVTPDDPAGWAAAIADLCASSAERRRMRIAGIAFAERFDGDRVAAQLRGVYDAVMAKKTLR